MRRAFFRLLTGNGGHAMEDFEQRLKRLERQVEDLCDQANSYRKTDPAAALTKARNACERICQQVCFRHGLVADWKKSERLRLQEMIEMIAKADAAPRYILDDMRTIQYKGNTAAHPQMDDLTPESALPALQALSNVVAWYFRKPKPEPALKTQTRVVLKNPLFEKAAVGVMAGTAIAIAAKFLGGNKDPKES